MSPCPITVSEAARSISEKLGVVIRPRDISLLFYERQLRDDLCPIVGGRRLIPPDYLPQIESALHRRRHLQKVQGAVTA